MDYQRRFLLVAVGMTVCSTLETLWKVTMQAKHRGLEVYHNTMDDRYYNEFMAQLPENGDDISIRRNAVVMRQHGQVKRGRRVNKNLSSPSWWRRCELIDKNQSTSTDVEPLSIQLDSNMATLLHVGKSAGGTFVERAFQCWRAFLNICHPGPCQHNRNNDKAIIITLRDPIDRFVSSFYWRLLIVCDYTDKRRRNKAAAHNPRHYCSRPLNGERRVLEYYNKNASKLAEKLCSSNATEKTLARENMKRIEHAQYSLHEHWLNFSWNTQNLFPIVMESNITDMERQTDQAIYWLHHRLQFESAHDFAQRATYASHRRVAGDLVHSSRSTKRWLTAAAEQCLARYFADDYEILLQLQTSTCKTVDCHRGLQSILERRSSLLLDQF